MILEIILSLIAFLALVSLVFILLIMTQKRRHNLKSRRVKLAREYLFSKYFDGLDVRLPVSPSFFLEALIDVEEQIIIEPLVRQAIIADFVQNKTIRKYQKMLASPSQYRRKMAAFYLGAFNIDQTLELLFQRFKKEKNEAVRLNLVIHMRRNIHPDYIPTFFESLVGARASYQKRLATLMGNYYQDIDTIFKLYDSDERFEIILALTRLAAFHSTNVSTDYLLSILNKVMSVALIEEKKIQLKKEVLDTLLIHRPDILIQDCFLNSEDELIKKHAILSIAAQPSLTFMTRLIDELDGGALDTIRVKTIARIVLENREYVDHLLRVYSDLDQYRKKVLAAVLSERIDYIILKLYRQKPQLLGIIITNMFMQGIIEPIIDFVNANVEKEIMVVLGDILRAELGKHETLLLEFRTYAKTDVLASFGLQSFSFPSEAKKKSPPEKGKIIWMSLWLSAAILLFPLIYLARVNVDIVTMTPAAFFQGFLIETNIYLVYYFLTINAIYVVLFFLALFGSTRQVRLARTRKYSLLFTNKLLPGISIIAPAYNEEVSVVDSVNSLLNLKYPNYEVIVVNDGSKDSTLAKLIEAFKLERKHLTFNPYLGTRKIRAIYKSKDIPNLIVVDKQNGGKADALNVGINVSDKEYVCGIDADSVLESDALLKLTSTMLDDTRPYIAMGGNIYPANGFKFDRGEVMHRSIPKGLVPRLQTIEYLRAFTSGRIGWSQARSLMIISGAFGLFNKRALIETGGYLTSSGQFKKDTVGEDMELVVRLTREYLEKKKEYRVTYVSNAYCYTELPSEAKTLLKQRNRWQRGLVDILSFHRKIIFNPRFKQIGMLGAPYFFIFEFLGPMLEAFGLVMLLVATLLGLLNLEILLAMFTVSIAFGVVISLSSLFMSEQDILMMSKRDTATLILYAIVENFGYRQLISIHRVKSSFSALKESGQWGSQVRKGFAK